MPPTYESTRRKACRRRSSLGSSRKDFSRSQKLLLAGSPRHFQEEGNLNITLKMVSHCEELHLQLCTVLSAVFVFCLGRHFEGTVQDTRGPRQSNRTYTGEILLFHRSGTPGLGPNIVTRRRSAVKISCLNFPEPLSVIFDVKCTRRRTRNTVSGKSQVTGPWSSFSTPDPQGDQGTLNRVYAFQLSLRADIN
ncbi:hypothetical protein RRG08_010189 [Elysia crispata]|uniref:Uncharacterized protein n=1 Tax=Elysia crispata TaxID=231223 RepID=A0AAE1E0D4_9GAST|nr:hypothetical protein RRG08_010189 [Elysia crispata]